MRHSFLPIVLGAIGASAAPQHGRCTFELTAHGHANGSIGQLTDGQCRIGGGYYPTTFDLDRHSGILKDKNGRGCIITRGKASQIQCDQGASGMFSETLLGKTLLK
jgi:hypothetical protein